MEKLNCLLDTPGLRVFYDEANNWLYNQWLGVHDEQSVKESVSDICSLIHTCSFTRILSDHSGLVGSWQGSVPWITRTYFDQLAAQGVTYFAWVYNESYHNRMAIEQMRRDLKSPIVDIFEDVASAYEWLRRCPDLTEQEPLATFSVECNSSEGPTFSFS
jgi:hypothetical protein